MSTRAAAEQIVKDAKTIRSASDGDQVSFAVVVPLPEYPVRAVSVGALGDLIKQATSTGLPAAMVGGAGLGIAGICAMPASLQPDPAYPSWVERPAVWVPLVAPRSGGKSPALRIARAPLDPIEQAAYEQWRDEMDDWRAAPAKERDTKPDRRRWTVDDITTEQVIRAMDQADGRIGAAVDELRTHLAGMGRYRTGGDGGDKARWLSIWDGAPVSYDRVGSDVSIRVAAPVVPIVGGIQPHYIGMLGEDEDGARARWIPHYFSGTVSSTPAPSSAAWDEWVGAEAGIVSSRTWHLDRVAYRAWRDAVRRWQAIEHRPDVSPAVAGAASKADRQALRVALILAETIDPGKGGPIPSEALTGAVALMDYAIGVWGVLGGAAETLATSRREETLIRASDRLAGWIAERGGRVTRRDIIRAAACGIRKAGQLDDVIAEYKQVYPGTVRDEMPEGGGPQLVV
ncbi:DUF3987 domain-containing protein [Parafrankia sp. FMc6]|uniref:DUF3987 domain-containing protein n=1 Tax=Parafrankia soli TaxID=2599596 RepID=UPI0034D527E4